MFNFPSYILGREKANSLRVSLNLLDIFEDLAMIVMYVFYLNLYAEAKHGPAITVIPVLMPMNPDLLNNLFVFYQWNTNFFFVRSHSTLYLYILVLTTSLKISIFRHIEHNLAISSHVVWLSRCVSPCGFPKVVYKSYNFLHSWFILTIKDLIYYLRSL